MRGKGNPESFCSCSHGAGRRMSRTAAKKRYTVADHELATAGVECRKDIDVIDETPMAYKDIDAVMAAQADLVEVVHTLRQVVGVTARSLSFVTSLATSLATSSSIYRCRRHQWWRPGAGQASRGPRPTQHRGSPFESCRAPQRRRGPIPF